MSMDSKAFLKEIRSIIREEIDYALDKRLSDKKKKTPTEAISHGVSLYKEAIQAAQKKQQKPQKQQQTKSKNMTSIQALLEQTRQSLEQGQQEDWPTMHFGSDSLNAFANNHVDATPQGIDHSQLTPEVSKALTRDYSALMAKINEKKGS